MYVVSSLVAHPQPAELVQPRQGSLDNPTVHPQPAAMAGAPPGDHRRDVARPQRFPVLPGIIRPVRIQPLRSAARAAAFAPHRRHRIRQWQQLSHVVAVGSGQDRRQRSPIGAGDPGMLASGFAAALRLRSGRDWGLFFPRLQPPGPMRCPHRPGTSPERQPLAVWTTGVRGDSAILRLHATLSDGASRSSPIRIPSPWAASPKGYRFGARKGCRSAPSGRLSAGVRDTGIAWAWQAAEGVGLSPIVHRSPVASPSVSPCPGTYAASLRRNQRLGEKVAVFQMLVKSFC